MTQPAKANSKRRVRRGVLIFALAGLLIVCASMNLHSLPTLPSISISDVRYEKPKEQLWGEPLLRANFALTNNGALPFYAEDFADFVRIETKNGWITNQYGFALKSWDSGSPPGTRSRFLAAGEGFPSEAIFPEAAFRWQAGYNVKVISPRKHLETKFGPKITKPIISLFGNWISGEDESTVLWGPVIEITNVALFPEAPSLHRPH